MPKAHVVRRYGGLEAEGLVEAPGRERGSGRRLIAVRTAGVAEAGSVDVRGAIVIGVAG
ncbi:hypothetical protein [Streptomyces sp. SLBN-31]|jgi:hypothetical protein|uniref:hypothetical protein n=1 Tax=Streptomyces sp. SLBN-31 TaxID=2768444 RepID=UPI001357A218|nr:hypothetical protein [Streptomyces sp. SLBN-31]